MNTLFAVLFGVLVGMVGAVIYYRRHTASVEKALAEAVKIRKDLEEAVNALRAKYGNG